MLKVFNRRGSIGDLMFWMEHMSQTVYGCSREEDKNRVVAGCEVCSTLAVMEDGEEETIGLRKKLGDVAILQDTLHQQKSGISTMKKEPTKIDDKLVLPETIHESSDEFPNNKCIICFFGKHENHSCLKPKDAIFLCEDCKYKIASFYMLHVQKWHELLSPRSKKKISLRADKKERPRSCVSSYKTGRRSKKPKKKTGRKSSQQVLMQRYEDGDPTVGPLGQPSGKFDYLVEYSTLESKRNSFNTSYENLFSPTGWGDTE